MSKVLVIGCGGVASVAISKCCQVSADVLPELHCQPYQVRGDVPGGKAGPQHQNKNHHRPGGCR